MPESSNKGGRKPRVTDEDLLDTFKTDPDPVLSTAEVADAVPIKRRGVLTRLRSLEEDGELASKQIGGRNTVWWLARGDTPADGFDAGDLQGNPDTTLDADTPLDTAPGDAGDERASTRREGAESITDAVDEIASTWGDRPARVDERKAAARAVLEYAREHGEVSKQEAINEVHPDHPVEGQNADTWYRNNIKPVLKSVGEYAPGTRSYHVPTDGQDDAGEGNT